MTRRNRHTRSHSLMTLAEGLILVLFCLALAVVLYGWNAIPSQAGARFGPPSPKLSAWQRVEYSAQLLWNQDNLVQAVDPTGSERQFKVELGEPAGTVAVQLQDQGLIPSADAFRNYLVYAGIDTGLQAGTYTLSPAWTPIQIAHKLQDATPKDVSFQILAGWRIEEIAASLPTSGLSVSPGDFIQAATHASGALGIDGMPAQVQSLEGFLLPGHYTIRRDITTAGLVAIFRQAFDQNVTQDMLNGIKQQNLSLYEAVTLASIVQKESVVADEEPVIASVFLNRLAAGMKLESDPTVQYALGYNTAQQTWWTNPLTADDLKVQSPYNTYLVDGLPPGPIANPSISALKAVAFPEQTSYYYFRARCDGSGRHAFAKTLEEQVNNACP